MSPEEAVLTQTLLTAITEIAGTSRLQAWEDGAPDPDELADLITAARTLASKSLRHLGAGVEADSIEKALRALVARNATKCLCSDGCTLNSEDSAGDGCDCGCPQAPMH